MNDTGQIIRQLIDNQYNSIKEFCEINGFQKTYISAILNGSKELGLNTAKRLVEIFPNITIDYLVYGKSINNDNLQVSEPQSPYGLDPMEKVFLSYLDKPSVRKKLQEITKSQEEITLKLELGEENSELIDRLEKMIQNDLTSQKGPKLRVITDKTKDDE